MTQIGKVYSINGSVVMGIGQATIREMVHVGPKKLIGEVIDITEHIVIQIFEDTIGLKAGDIVYGTGLPLSITLGPGLLGSVFDGIGKNLQHQHINNLSLQEVATTTIESEWYVTILVKKGEDIASNTKVAVVQETSLINHYIISPKGGIITFVVQNGKYKKNETLISIGYDNYNVSLCTTWQVKQPRPILSKSLPISPLITGQRVIDTFFPIAKGGACAIPGGFGTGKTITMHQISKYAHADILVYVGCGERGNEIKGILNDFEILKDPKTNNSILDRTVIIANTSNMPVSAREASIYTGATIAEYYRDMGYDVVLVADSISRFAEGLREISGRLMEIPADEGYPSYLPSRLASFYERSGDVTTLCGEQGSVTIISSVSPQGGDMNDIVTIHTKRYVRCFWELDRNLAYNRHFPAINWSNSYSEYIEDMTEWYKKNCTSNFLQNSNTVLNLLNQETQLHEIVKLIGEEVLHDSQKLILQIGIIIRRNFLNQNALSKKDSYTPIDIQGKLIEIILHLYESCKKLVTMHIPVSVLVREGVFITIESINESEFTYATDLNHYFGKINAVCGNILNKYEGVI